MRLVIVTALLFFFVACRAPQDLQGRIISVKLDRITSVTRATGEVKAYHWKTERGIEIITYGGTDYVVGTVIQLIELL